MTATTNAYGPPAALVRDREALVDELVQIELQLAGLTDEAQKLHDRNNSHTMAFFHAKGFIEGAWRNATFARQTLQNN